jgi:DNA-binding GntR family transcriptional regulator
MSLTYLVRATSLDGVLDALRAAIFRNAFPPGSRLKQSAIASELGVSQGVVREALARLTEEGLVTNVPYRGVYVSVLTGKDIQDLYQMRTALECLAVELALPRLREKENMERLEALAKRVREEVPLGNSGAAAAADVEFHKYVVDLAGNARLSKAWQAIAAQSIYLFRFLFSLEPSPNESDQTPWVEAFKTGSVESIQGMIRERFRSITKRLLENWPPEG